MCTLIPGRLEGAGPELRSEVAGAVVLAVALQEVQGLQLQERGGGRGWSQRPGPLSRLAPPCHRAGLTWLLSEPTRLPSTGANGEVHTRFWGERLSGISPGRLKATGLACGGGGGAG